MAKFAIGDKVKIVETFPESEEYYTIGAFGIVSATPDILKHPQSYLVEFKGGTFMHYADDKWFVAEYQLEKMEV